MASKNPEHIGPIVGRVMSEIASGILWPRCPICGACSDEPCRSSDGKPHPQRLADYGPAMRDAAEEAFRSGLPKEQLLPFLRANWGGFASENAIQAAAAAALASETP